MIMGISNDGDFADILVMITPGLIIGAILLAIWFVDGEYLQGLFALVFIWVVTGMGIILPFSMLIDALKCPTTPPFQYTPEGRQNDTELFDIFMKCRQALDTLSDRFHTLPVDCIHHSDELNALRLRLDSFNARFADVGKDNQIFLDVPRYTRFMGLCACIKRWITRSIVLCGVRIFRGKKGLQKAVIRYDLLDTQRRIDGMSYYYKLANSKRWGPIVESLSYQEVLLGLYTHDYEVLCELISDYVECPINVYYTLQPSVNHPVSEVSL